MKRLISRNHGLFKTMQALAHAKPEQNPIKYDTNAIQISNNDFSLASLIIEYTNENQAIKHQYELNKPTSKIAEVSDAFEKNALLFTINIYRSRLEEGKRLLEQHKLTGARSLFSSLVTEIEQIYQKIHYAELTDAYKQLLSEAYTYEGKTFCVGTKQKNIALAKFDKAIELNPSYELPKKEKEAILIGRGILPDGQTLVFESDENVLQPS